jgi:hypothetical protein
MKLDTLESRRNNITLYFKLISCLQPYKSNWNHVQRKLSDVSQYLCESGFTHNVASTTIPSMQEKQTYITLKVLDRETFI